MANEQKFDLTRTLSMKDISEINRAIGIVEGLAYAVQDPGVADGLIGAVERIDVVVNMEEPKDGE